jgi:hypothetical protein
MRLVYAVIPLALLLSATIASAQSPMPVGSWMTDDGSEDMTISDGSTCGFGANGTYSVVGACSWDPSGAGGILTIMNANQYQPAPIYYNVIWVDDQTISVFGDVFHRRG